MKLSLIVAVAENNVIGRDGDLPWRLSADLQRFKRTTMGHVMLMGRRTWESIGRPLPGRTSIVISRQANYRIDFEEVRIASSLDNAISQAGVASDVFIIGGAAIYASALPQADRLLLTRVHASVEGDVHFPEVDWNQWQLVDEQHHAADDKNDFDHTYQVFERAN